MAFHRTTSFQKGALVALSVSAASLSACNAELGNAGSDDPSDGVVSSALGTTYQVGPGRTYKKLGQIASLLQPGDVVNVDGNATYTEDLRLTKAGTAASKITIHGVRVNGKRPVLVGSVSAIEFAGDHYAFDGFEVTGGSSRCMFHHADDITVRDTAVHDCPSHGILGADADSGSLTLDYVEVYNAGSGETRHSVYIATDETAHPGSVFRMQHSYIHDGRGGNSVKSRAERTELYSNWIEGASYEELGLYGPDGQAENLAREDSDIVGNVIHKTGTSWYVARIGGDGTGQTWGRYRFVNNTVLLSPSAQGIFRINFGIESLEAHNNAFYRLGGGSIVVAADGGTWLSGSPIITGTHNLMPTGSTLPSGWTGTVLNNNPGFLIVGTNDVRLAAGSPLIDTGLANPPSPSGHPFLNPLFPPAYLPPLHTIEAVGTAQVRPTVGSIDIGAFEYGTSAAPPPTSTGTSTPPPPPPPASCVSGQAGSAWPNTATATKTGSFTAQWDVTPSAAACDGAVALAPLGATTWTGLAAIVRFNPTNTIDVRNGSVYGAAKAIGYVAGSTYHVRMVGSVATHTYSVYITPPGGVEQLIASNYAFRTEQASVSELSDMAVATGGTASIQACNFSIQ